MKTHKGLAMPLVLGGIIVIVAAILFVALKSRTTPEAVVQHVADSAMQKTEDAKDVAMEKGVEIAEDGIEKAKDAAMEKVGEVMEEKMEDGKTIVGEAMKDAGDKMIDATHGADSAGSFEDYSAEKVAANDGAVLFFHAPWCPTCKALEKDLVARATEIPSGVAILKTNYDTEFDLRKKHGVTLQHTLVQVDASGNAIKTWRGGNTLDSIVKNVQ